MILNLFQDEKHLRSLRFYGPPLNPPYVGGKDEVMGVCYRTIVGCYCTFTSGKHRGLPLQYNRTIY